jgi:hypothetical protein
MEDFVIYTVIGLSALAGIVFMVVAAVGIYCLSTDLYRATISKPEVLLPPDRATRRTYDQQYFDKAVSKE